MSRRPALRTGAPLPFPRTSQPSTTAPHNVQYTPLAKNDCIAVPFKASVAASQSSSHKWCPMYQKRGRHLQHPARRPPVRRQNPASPPAATIYPQKQTTREITFDVFITLKETKPSHLQIVARDGYMTRKMCAGFWDRKNGECTTRK